MPFASLTSHFPLFVYMNTIIFLLVAGKGYGMALEEMDQVQRSTATHGAVRRQH